MVAEEAVGVGVGMAGQLSGGGGGGVEVGRRLLVAMKLSASCREMLTWTIAKLAQPGDHILALHVSETPLANSDGDGALTEEAGAAHAKQLANTLRGVLSVYESLCNLKQIKLQLEIVTGYKVKNVLVEVASSYEACKLILGTNKIFSVGRTKALGRYCLKRLPCTCTVVILEQGEIIFDKKGRLGADITRLDMIKVLRRSMRIGKSNKRVGSGGLEGAVLDDCHTDKPLQSSSLAEIPNSLQISGLGRGPQDVMSFGSCSSALHEDYSSSPVSVLPLERRNSASGFEALRMSFSKRRAQGTLKAAAQVVRLPAAEDEDRSDMFLLVQDATLVAENSPPPPPPPPPLPLLLLPPPPSPSPPLCSKGFDDAEDSEDAFVPGWPLLNNTIGLETETKKKPPPKTLDRELSIVKWALQLPDRGHGPSPSPKEFLKEEAEAKSRVRDSSLSLSQEVECLCLHRPCTAFGYEDLEAATSGFSQDNVVGRGGGSEVFRGEMKDGRIVAVKRLNQSPQAEEELLIDIEINTTLSHTHIVSLLGYCVESSHMLLVYDYLPEGNLEDHLHAPGKDAAVLSWEVRQNVAVGIARALEYLHKGSTKPVVHRDVKTSNILLTADFESQLSDFGLAKWAPTKASHLLCNDVVGTFGYLAPEYFMYGRVNDKTDVYAFGVVLLELITGRKPIDTTRPKGEENLVNWARPLLVERALDKLVDPVMGVYDVGQMNNMLIASFLSIQQSAQRRPQMSQILRVLSGDHEETLSTCVRPEEVVSASDPEEVDTASYGNDETSIRSHLALAMLGVDDDANSLCSVDILSSVDMPHSNKYLEEYLEGRFSRSASFED